jgi:L-ascorbate metabolism protein UlaG (beta-lactamase superfamily)
VYFAGDTDVFSGMSSLGCPDVALLPVSGWGRRVPAGAHMDARRAAESLKLLRPQVAIPIHWGTFTPAWRRGAYPAQGSAAEDFRRQANGLAPQVEVCVLAPGDTLEYPHNASKTHSSGAE